MIQTGSLPFPQRRRTAWHELRILGLASFGWLGLWTLALAQESPVKMRLAIERGDLATVEAMLNAGASVSTPLRDPYKPYDGTPLEMAVRCGDKPIVELLIRRGAPLNEEGLDNYTPLVRAADRGDYDMVQFLLQRGADINQTATCNFTALMVAAQNNQPRLVAMLLKRGADKSLTHRTSEEGEDHNALGCAASNGAEAAARVLLAAGMDPAANDYQAVKLARENGYPKMAAFLSKPADFPVSLPVESPLKAIPIPDSIPSLSVAIAPFVTDDFSYKSAEKAHDFSALLISELSGTPRVTLVERAELERAEKELGMSLGGITTPDRSVRLGKWVKANILVTGRFSEDQGHGAQLQLEAVDLQRGELLAGRSVIVKMPEETRFGFTPELIKSCSAQVRSLLGEAAIQMVASRNQVLVAPLFFRNANPQSDRLNFVERDLLQAIQENSNAKTRVLRFPASRAAAEETMLALLGLAESEPDAWKRVADYYVWGDFEETNSSSVPFADVTVEFRLNVWDGATEPKARKFQSRVADLAATIKKESSQLIGDLSGKPSIPPSETIRDQVAKSLYQRFREVSIAWKDDGFGEVSYQRAVQFRENRLRLLELSHFLTPADKEIAFQLLLERWNNSIVFSQTARKDKNSRFKNHWQRSEDWRQYVKQHGLASLNQPLEINSQFFKLPVALYLDNTMTSPREDRYISMPLEMIQMVTRGYDTITMPDELPGSVSERWVNQLLAEAGDRMEQTLREKPENFHVPIMAFDFTGSQDAAVKARVASILWKASASVEQRRPELWKKLKATLVDSLTQLGRSNEIPNYPGHDSPAPPPAPSPPQDQFDSPSRNRQPKRQPRERQSNRRQFIERQSAQPRTVGQKPAEPETPAQSPAERPPGEWEMKGRAVYLGKKVENAYVKSLQFHQGRLWITANLQLRPTLRQCGLAWTLDPQTGRLDRIENIDLPSHNAITSGLAQGENFWLAGSGAGVVRYSVPSKELKSYADRDGVSTDQPAVLAEGDGLVFVGGGSSGAAKGTLGAYDPSTGQWSGIFRPAPAGLNRVCGLAHSQGRLLLAEESNPDSHTLELNLYDPKKKLWETVPGQPGSLLTPCVSGNTYLGVQVICLGDAQGFWVAGGATLLRIDGTTLAVTKIDSPGGGVITGLAGDGEKLWVATAIARQTKPLEATITAAVTRLDKKTLKKDGWFRLRENGPVTGMAISSDKIWMAIDNRYGSETDLLEADKPPVD